MFFIYYDFENFRLDVENEKLLKNDAPVLLTQKAFQILLLLIENTGQLVKKESLISEIWQDNIVEDANITQQIYILRKVLGNDKNGKPLIETLPKRGYCFVGEVQKINSRANQTLHPLNYSNDETAAGSLPQASPKFISKRLSYIGLGLLFILLIFVSILFFLSNNKTTETTGINSIAVLPFKKLGNEDDDSKIEFGLTDAIINNLSKQQKIPVRSISAVFHYANLESFDSIEAGKNLGVDSVLEGTVQRDGEKVRVSLRLVKIADGSTLWAEVFNEKFSNIFALQDSISVKVANSLSINLAPQDRPSLTKQPSNSEAYQFYQLGVYFSNTRTKDGLQRAITYFQKAIELDSNYAPPYAMLADSYNWLNEIESGVNRQVLLDKSEEAAKKALALDDSFAEAHIALAFVQFVKDKDYEAGKRSLELAVQLAPFNPTARLHYGWEILYSGDLAGAYPQLVLAQEYAPLSSYNNLTLCSVLMFKKDYEQALKFCKKSAELQPNTRLINVQIANILFLMGKTDEAVNLLKLESENPAQKYEALGSLAYIYAKTGKQDEAKKIYQELKESKETQNKYSDLTTIAFALGKKDEALKHFKRMLDKSIIPPKFLIFDPFWEEILKEDDFRQTLFEKTT